MILTFPEFRPEHGVCGARYGGRGRAARPSVHAAGEPSRSRRRLAVRCTPADGSQLGCATRPGCAAGGRCVTSAQRLRPRGWHVNHAVSVADRHGPGPAPVAVLADPADGIEEVRHSVTGLAALILMALALPPLLASSYVGVSPEKGI